MKRARRPIGIVSMILLCVIILGYVSNMISVGACERVTRMDILHALNASSAEAKRYIDNVHAKEAAGEDTNYMRIPATHGLIEERTVKWIPPSMLVASIDDKWNTFSILGKRFTKPWFLLDYMYHQKERDYRTTPMAYIVSYKWHLPFVTKVDYGWVYDVLWGQGGTKYYICVFGYAIEAMDRVSWFS